MRTRRLVVILGSAGVLGAAYTHSSGTSTPPSPIPVASAASQPDLTSATVVPTATSAA